MYLKSKENERQTDRERQYTNELTIHRKSVSINTCIYLIKVLWFLCLHLYIHKYYGKEDEHF